MRVFLDTNVVVSAFATRGLAADARIRGEALAARADVLVTGDKDVLEVAGKITSAGPDSTWILDPAARRAGTRVDGQPTSRVAPQPP